MNCQIVPWVRSEDRSCQLAKIAGYGIVGALLSGLGITLSQVKPIIQNGKVLKAIPAALMGAGTMAEGAALISAAVGVKKPSRHPGNAEPVEAEHSSSAELPDPRASLYEQIHADEPDLRRVRACCRRLGAKGLSEPWGPVARGNTSYQTPVAEVILCLADRQRANQDTSQLTEILRLLLSSGASYDRADIHWASPLESALEKLRGGLQDEVVKLLMSEGASFPTWTGQDIARMEKINPGLTEESRILLNKARTEEEALIRAVSDGEVDSARELLASGRAPDVHVHGGGVLPGEHKLQESQLKGGAHSSSYGRRVQAERLAASAPREGAIPREHVPPDVQSNSDGENLSILQIAIRNEDLEMVKLLLEYRASVEADGPAQLSPLGFAVTQDVPNFVIVQLLLDAGANTLSVSGGSTMPPVIAALRRDADSGLAQHLVNQCREQHLQNLAKYPPAARTEAKELELTWNEIEVLQAELKKAFEASELDLVVIRGIAHQLAAALNAPIAFDGLGEVPPLLMAMHRNSPAAARVLLEEGADPNERGIEGWGAFHFLIENLLYHDQNPFVQLLLEHGGQIPSSPEWNLTWLEQHCSENLYELMIGQLVLDKEFLRKGADEGDTEQVKLYLDLGFPADLVWFEEGEPPRSALRIACDEGNVEVVRMLVAAGAPASQDDLDAETSDEIKELLKQHRN